MKKNMWAYTWLRPALHSSHQEYLKKERKRSLRVRPTQRERKILTHTSLPYATFRYVKSTFSAHCAENGMPVEKLATQKKPLELYRSATELSRVAENTNNLQKRFMNVAELLQICRETKWVSVLSVYCGRGLNRDVHLTSIQLRHGWRNWIMHVELKRY